MKTCQAPNCFNPVFGGHMCKWHQRLRDDKKPKPIASRSDKQTNLELSFGVTTQSELFGILWDNAKNEHGDVICPCTGEQLNRFKGHDVYWSLFAHVLPKGRYPYFKLNPDNVRVVHYEFHRIIDQGTIKDRENHPEWKWDEWDALVIEMKEKYAQFKREHQLP